MPSQENPGRDLISVAVADRTRIHTQLLAAAIRSDPGLHVVAPESAPQDLLDTVKQVPIDVVVVSFALENYSSGPALLRELRQLRPQIRGIVMLDSSRAPDIFECFRAGAAGILSSNSKPQDLLKCIRCVHQGQVWASSSELAHVMDALANLPVMRATRHDGADLLSAREREVIQYVASGMTNREIAQALKLSPHTVKNYLFRIFEKLGVSNRTELLALTMNKGLQSGNGNGSAHHVGGLTSAAESGDLLGQLRLAEYHCENIRPGGDPEARTFAYMWYLLAESRLGPLFQRIAEGKQRVRRLLSPQQLAEAERRAAEWLKSKKKDSVSGDTPKSGRSALAAGD